MLVASSEMTQSIKSAQRILQRNFPNEKKGTAGPNIIEIVKKRVGGTPFKCSKEGQLNIAIAKVPPLLSEWG